MRTIIGLGYLVLLCISQRIAVALTPPRRGHIEEYPDELGLWWVDDD